VLRVSQTLADSWSTREVVERWHDLFGGTALSERYLREQALLEVEQQPQCPQCERTQRVSKRWVFTCLGPTGVFRYKL